MATTGSVKAKIQGLIEKSNAFTDKTDTTMTDAVDSLIEKASKGASLNIAYGDIAPEDTSKLWVKTSEPSKVIVSPNAEYELTGELGVELVDAVLPVGSASIGTAIVGGKVYMFGGDTDVGTPSESDKIYCFDPDTQTVSEIGTMELSGWGMVTAAVDTKIYLLGGTWRQLKKETIRCYDTELKTMTTLSAQLPKALSVAEKGVLGSKIYVIGGESSNKNIYCFDAETETVTTLSATLPYVISETGCATVGGRVYMFGNGKNSTGKNYIVCFDMNTETRTTISTRLPSNKGYNTASAIGSKIYIFGALVDGKYSDEILCYDTISQEIEVLGTTLPHGFYFGAGDSITVDDGIYIFGGLYNNGTSNVYSTEIQRFSEGVRTICVENGGLHILPTQERNIFPLINTETAKVDIGANRVYKGNADGLGEQVEAALYKNGTWTTI